MEDPLYPVVKAMFDMHGVSDLYDVSMDHSPSEQLVDIENWYTTVLVISGYTEHWQMASEVAHALRPRYGSLQKWNKAKRAYRENFYHKFSEHLEKYPVYVFAVSASKSSINLTMDQFLRELGVENLWVRELVDGRVYYKFGPYMMNGCDELRYTSLPENRMTMALFICHFVLRVYGAMSHCAGHASAGAINWNMLVDKFPGAQKEGMGLVIIQLLKRATASRGSVNVGHYTVSDEADSDLLADNLAGYFRSVIKENKSLPCVSNGKGLLYWENWPSSCDDDK